MTERTEREEEHFREIADELSSEIMEVTGLRPLFILRYLRLAYEEGRAPLLDRIATLEPKCILLSASLTKAEKRIAELEGMVRRLAEPMGKD